MSSLIGSRQQRLNRTQCWAINSVPSTPPRPRYVSPNPEKPNLGVLAADAVRVMARYIQNHVGHVEGIGALKLEPPGDLSVPPLRTYVYIPVTGQIISRVPTGDDQDPQSAKKKNVASGSSSSTATSTPQKADTALTPSTPVPKGVKRKLQLDKDDDEDDDIDGADDDEDEVEDDAAAELEMLDQLEKASSSSKKKKKGIRTAKTTGGTAK